MIVDTIGELKALYSIATIVFIGGSLAFKGGQNFIEPASFGKPVICGPDMHNFPDARVFLEQDALIQIMRAEDLAASISSLLKAPEIRKEIGHKAQAIVEASKGSVWKNLDLCKQFLMAPLAHS